MIERGFALTGTCGVGCPSRWRVYTLIALTPPFRTGPFGRKQSHCCSPLGCAEYIALRQLHYACKSCDMQLNEKGRQLHLKDGRVLEAELIIAADGRDSSLRSMAGIKVTGWEYNQDGLVATVTTELDHQFTAWQRFLEEGPLAFLPLKNGQCSIVWTLSSETSKHHLSLPDKDFLEVLEQASGGILGKMLEVGPTLRISIYVFNLQNNYIGQRFAVCGDAAHAMHPLAGQGVNAGLLDAATIAELVIQTGRKNRPLASPRFSASL